MHLIDKGYFSEGKRQNMNHTSFCIFAKVHVSIKLKQTKT